GRGWIAERILQAAFDHGIKVREDADLAGILATLEIGEEIPVEAFIAVAEILRYVYAANNAAPPEVS
ncbi:MAG: EscU/YscU/HrcU family type III secretion system export apparatus switch protein, partial [Alphaproteobacteria bacterium]